MKVCEKQQELYDWIAGTNYCNKFILLRNTGLVFAGRLSSINNDHVTASVKSDGDHPNIVRSRFNWDIVNIYQHVVTK
ncbi:hypothetical protein J6590_033552 [Homalodisca vitripennis]|nr:hypothetical protein J6590_033552 [Homalodisca vitripennis]